MIQTVMLVDDDQNLLNSIQRLLRKEEYRIVCATSAEMALQILQAESIDLVVSDQEMPGMRGTEFLIQVQKLYPNIVRFILTGRATLDVAVEAINKGAISRFFTKPCNVIDLAFSIRQGLEHKALLSKAMSLLRKVEMQSALLKQIEQENPGIGEIQRDSEGSIIIEEDTNDFGAFMKRINDTLNNT